MAGPHHDEEDEKPLDPAVERVRKKLVRFAVINIGLLLVAVMAVAGALVYKSRTTQTAVPAVGGDIPAPAGGVLSGDIVLPAGAKIVSQSISGGRISLDAELADGSRTIFVYDLAERRIIGQFAVKAQ
ncbi:MAG: fimbrial protein [Kaistia sp. SCN 65-12]|nr:MAG: fimbrial protein [Kaistia sp. SCN 65-12]